MTCHELVVRLRSIARALETADRVGADTDEPEGARVIELSESLVVETIIPALDEATMHLLGLAEDQR